MFILGNLFYGIANVLRIVINFFEISIVISSIFSFISFNYHNPIRNFFDQVSELINRPVRRLFGGRLVVGMFDFTPFVSILILILLDSFLVNTLFDLARVLR
ncbi:hypothetical protein XO10_04955 [Marinitoga sp. 1135]|uniref:YGGT family protein n=1 Tax=Marinitoga piezophila (strain DSM 14283 / JCM 11233 / KA3) TaxID=443254 RepID=H2J7M1_MARPK|nr:MULTISPECIES: YggT family protein [Marinitoga]AEX85362.1 YGGT family protein [Marinitoga piezophila KA3]APT75840.1 hypothetical protein LN42_05210 [Marinitoga sp. 1137]NUU95624.1 hypothetical protein [Marinitoga sp. 1135]NUU97497.1 hypothetical protein [Marinitoga sp. 1138]